MVSRTSFISFFLCICMMAMSVSAEVFRISPMNSDDEFFEKLDGIHRQTKGPRTDTKKLEQEYLDLLKVYDSPENQGRIYFDMTEMFCQTGLKDPSPTVKYAQLALTYPQPLYKRLKLYILWGDAIQMSNHRVSGGTPEEARKKELVPFLEGIKVALDNQLPMDKVPFPEFDRVIRSGMDPESEEYRQYVEDMRKSLTEQERIREINQAIDARNDLKGKIIYMYSRKPYATEELSLIATETLDDPSTVEELVRAVEKAIADRELNEKVRLQKFKARRAAAASQEK